MTFDLGTQQLHKIVREALGGTGVLVFLPHADRELLADTFDRNDARNAMKRGRVTAREVDMDGEERLTIEGPPVDDPTRELGVVCKVESIEPPRVVVITAFNESTRYGRRPKR